MPNSVCERFWSEAWTEGTWRFQPKKIILCSSPKPYTPRLLLSQSVPINTLLCLLAQTVEEEAVATEEVAETAMETVADAETLRETLVEATVEELPRIQVRFNLIRR